MKICSLNEARRSLGRFADAALRGHPTVISYRGKLLILQIYKPMNPDEFDALINEGINSVHLPVTDAFWKGVSRRGIKLAQKLKHGQD